MSGENNNVPKLRFKDAQGYDFPEWEDKRLGDVATFSSGGTPSKKVAGYWNGKIPWISAVSMHTDVIEKSEAHVTEFGAKNGTKLAEEGTVLLLVRGSMLFNRIPAGICARIVAFNQDVKALSVDDTNSPWYLLFFIRAYEHRLLSLVTGTGIGAGKLDTAELKALPFAQPSLPEQQKIASFLSAIDTKIAQITKKKALLEQYKRGVMQKLFSWELRFKDTQGKAFPDWVEKRLSSLTKLITKGTTPTSVGFRFQKTGINFVKVESLDDHFNIIEQKLAKISTECHEDLKRSQIENGDILFSIAGTLGRTAIARKKDIPANTNQAISIIRLRNAKAAKFVNYVLNSSAIRKRIRQILSVGAQPNLSLEQVGQFKIFLPVHQEQQKIATCLSSIDRKISLVTTEINHTQTFKKGLLQQMFV